MSLSPPNNIGAQINKLASVLYNPSCYLLFWAGNGTMILRHLPGSLELWKVFSLLYQSDFI